MFKVVKKSEANVRIIADNKIAIDFITKDITKEISLAIIETNKYHGKEISAYNRIYFVIEGELHLIIDKKEVSLTSGDTCFIGKHTSYEMKGTCKTIVIDQPAFGT